MKTKALLVVTCLSLCLTACNKEETQAPAVAEPAKTTSSAPEQNQNYPTYNVGSEISYEPFSFKDEMGRPAGFEVELLTAVGQAAKFNVVFLDHPRSELAETLNQGKYDMWSSALSINAERKEQMDFSDPYFDAITEVYILDKPENANIQSVADLKGKKISVNKGSKTSLSKAESLSGSADNVVPADSFFLSLKNTYQGKADGTLGDSRVLQYYKIKLPEMKARTISIGDEKKDLAFAVKKGNKELLDKINQGLASIKADGTYDKLVEKWFGYQTKK